ncbi:MAG: PEGA domain-containing protein [Proteobacteria bacterium]|nr:PEGA domain-containing protein [Pseudomonadota bacterium]
MKRMNLKTLSFILCYLVLLPCRISLAERTKVIVVLDVEAESKAAPADEIAKASHAEEALIQLTEAVYAAATEVSPEFFSVVSREKLLSVLELQETEKEKPLSSPVDIGTLLGADMVFSGQLRQTSTVGLEVTLKLVETGSGRILGLERAEAQEMNTLWGEVRKVARQMLLPLVMGGFAGTGSENRKHPDSIEPKSHTPKQRSDFLVQFRTTPADASVQLDGKIICQETPCSYRVEPGNHTLAISAENYKEQKKQVNVGAGMELVFELEPKKYNYLGMHDADMGGYGVTVGISPLDSDDKSISVLDGFYFANLHPVIDVGFSGQIFGYRQTHHGNSWSILGFGPAIRAGRLIITSQVQLLSFRPNSDTHHEGWLPGITTRAQIPLINQREAGGWAALIPTPTVGIDVWFHHLDYDQYQFWLGLSWLGGVDF